MLKSNFVTIFYLINKKNYLNSIFPIFITIVLNGEIKQDNKIVSVLSLHSEQLFLPFRRVLILRS